MLEAKTISIAIRRSWHEVFELVWKPEDFPKWASGLSRFGLRKDGTSWIAEGPGGTARIRFTPKNEFGIMDHWVDLGRGRESYVPLRIVANENGSEVLLTLFRQHDMSDEKFQRDVEWVTRDLSALKRLAEGAATPGSDRTE